jgi:hypothetical protein
MLDMDTVTSGHCNVPWTQSHLTLAQWSSVSSGACPNRFLNCSTPICFIRSVVLVSSTSSRVPNQIAFYHFAAAHKGSEFWSRHRIPMSTIVMVRSCFLNSPVGVCILAAEATFKQPVHTTTSKRGRPLSNIVHLI